MSTVTVETKTEVTRKISKVKLIKTGGVLVQFEQTINIKIDQQDVEQIADVPYTGKNIPHPDLLYAFKLLRPHLAILCQQLDGRENHIRKIEEDEDFMSNFNVTGISIGGSGEHEGATIFGTKKIKRGVLNLVAPFTKFFDEIDPYENVDEFSHLVTHTLNEAELYIEGKIAPNAQTAIDFDGSGDDEDLPE